MNEHACKVVLSIKGGNRLTDKARPVIAITMGDAAGIGPEVVVKALLSRNVYDICRPLVIGDGATLLAVITMLDNPAKLSPVSTVREVRGQYSTIDLIDLHNLEPGEVIIGEVCQACGRAAMEYIAVAAQMALHNEVRSIVTAPINKEATIAAGYGDVGHLEYLARLSQATEYATMLCSGNLRVVHLTTHHSLIEACQLVTKEKIMDRLKLTDQSFRQWGVSQPRIAVASLNPHGGEGGLFGSEEIEQILPAVTEARNMGINAHGPFPADSVFNRAIHGEFDVVLAMYHDQGHIPVKVHGFESSISIALGLPFIRTSVDHGTAFEIAGKGIADCRSLEEAIRIAVNLTKGKLVVDS